MKNPPVIVIQLVHIQGPLKGEIQEFAGPVVTIGRNPSCDLHFPKDSTAISRQHARITREGNRFKLIDESTNGTFVNGKRVPDAFLKDGDVLTFSEGGPKVSFLTQVSQEDISPSVETTEPTSPPPQAAAPAAAVDVAPAPPPPPPPPKPEVVQAPSPSPQRVQAPLVIQYGPTLRSYKELPVAVGKAPGMDFTLDHGAILDRHAEFFFSQGQYFVRDLTGRNLLLVNGTPIEQQALLNANDLLALSPQGPVFRFLAGGRLVEVDMSESGLHPPESAGDSAEPSRDKAVEGEGNKAKAIFKKFLRR